MITAEQVRELFDYDSDTGVLTWRDKSKKRQVEPGYVNKFGYRCFSYQGYYYSAHRLIWAWVHGEWPKGQIDHINHVRDDNRISNLRDVSPEFNQKHVKAYKNSPLGRPGVTFVPDRSKWRVFVGRTHIGYFKCLLDAVAARFRAEQEHGYTNPEHPSNG